MFRVLFSHVNYSFAFFSYIFANRLFRITLYPFWIKGNKDPFGKSLAKSLSMKLLEKLDSDETNSNNTEFSGIVNCSKFNSIALK